MRRFFTRIILATAIVFFPLSGVFADAVSDTITSSKEIETTVNNYILGVYKLQGNKILQDLDVSLQKLTLSPQERIEAYASIQATLRLRKSEVLKDVTLQKNSRTILLGYLDYMIQSLEDRKTNTK